MKLFCIKIFSIFLCLVASFVGFVYSQESQDLTIKSDGKVGIGTTTPTEALEVNGRIKDQTGYVAPVGTIVMYGGNTAPTGWLLCDGSAISRTVVYDRLFAVIGTTFGAGNGSTTFNVPDMRGVFPRGAGTSAKLSNANGTAFAGILGTYENDRMQGHKHAINHNHAPASLPTNLIVVGGNNASGYPDYGWAGGYNWGTNEISVRFDLPNFVGDSAVSKTDTTNGTPRAGTETNPANLALNYIIKY